MAEMKLTIGCDPELQLSLGRKKAGEFIPAWELTNGTKEAPVPIKGSARGIRVQSDGVALEFNIDPVDLSKISGIQAFAQQIRFARGDISAALGVTLGYDAISSNYSDEVLTHPLANAHGCDPDFDAYSEHPTSPRVVDFSKLNPKIKMFGGHVHIGYDQELAPPYVVARLMDIFYSCWTGRDFHKPTQRTLVYGRPGIFRPKPYGVEYRTPSPRWLPDDGAFLVGEAVYNVGFYLTHFRTEVIDIYKKINWDEVQSCLINCDSQRQSLIYDRVKESLNKTTGVKWQKLQDVLHEDDIDDDGDNGGHEPDARHHEFDALEEEMEAEAEDNARVRDPVAPQLRGPVERMVGEDLLQRVDRIINLPPMPIIHFNAQRRAVHVDGDDA